MQIKTWAGAFHQVIASVFAGMVTDFTPEDLDRDLMQDGFYVSKSLHDKIVAAFTNAGYVITQAIDTDNLTAYITTADQVDQGVMVTQDPEDEEAFVFAYFQH